MIYLSGIKKIIKLFGFISVGISVGMASAQADERSELFDVLNQTYEVYLLNDDGSKYPYLLNIRTTPQDSITCESPIHIGFEHLYGDVDINWVDTSGEAPNYVDVDLKVVSSSVNNLRQSQDHYIYSVSTDEPFGLFDFDDSMVVGWNAIVLEDVRGGLVPLPKRLSVDESPTQIADLFIAVHNYCQ